MATRTASLVAHCAFCAMHNHGHCVGACACADRAHNPDTETAAAMRSYESPGEARLPVETRASNWHRKDESR